MKLLQGGITAPAGFLAHGLHSGIKSSKKEDLALIYSEVPCSVAGVFTTNKVQASCVTITKDHIKDGVAQAIIANSGNANCMTGKRGVKDSLAMAAIVSELLDVPKRNVCVASTGVIGRPLPIQKILSAAPRLVRGLSKKGSTHVAAGILTTDHVIKEVAAECLIGGKHVRIGAIAKGAGMIRPRMELPGVKHATMLCFATTDASIAPPVLKKALNGAIQNTFNMMTIDGDTSTNDMVLILANGKAGNKPIAAFSKEFELFSSTLEALFLALAKKMLHDAEGATKFVEVVVKNAASAHDARMVALSVANSNLVKCALFGSDPNWGRIAAAVGYSGARIDPWRMRIYLDQTLVVKNGGPVKTRTSILDRIFAKKDIRILIDIGLGHHRASAYTCDLSTGYVKINSAYRT